jgi:hypothetical protein
LSEVDFRARSKAKYDKDKRSAGPYQVWLFRAIQPGDRIIANNGRTSILGVGIVTEGYRYRPAEHAVEGEDFPHQIKVKWDDITVRDIEDQADARAQYRRRSSPSAVAGGRSRLPTRATSFCTGRPGPGRLNVRRRASELLGDATATDAPNDHVQPVNGCAGGQIVFCTFHQAFATRSSSKGYAPSPTKVATFTTGSSQASSSASPRPRRISGKTPSSSSSTRSTAPTSRASSAS